MNTPTHFERVQLDAAGRQVDWNGPFLDVEEATQEAEDMVAEYRGIGWSVLFVQDLQWHAYDAATGAERWILVRPMWVR